jgi:hypothetical protein
MNVAERRRDECDELLSDRAAAASYDPANTAAATAAANATASSGARVLWLCRVLVVTDGLRVAEVGVAEAPASHSVVPRLIATSHVVVSELFHGLEGVKTSSSRLLHTELLCRSQTSR